MEDSAVEEQLRAGFDGSILALMTETTSDARLGFLFGVRKKTIGALADKSDCC